MRGTVFPRGLVALVLHSGGEGSVSILADGIEFLVVVVVFVQRMVVMVNLVLVLQ
jgi:hypothetical protein